MKKFLKKFGSSWAVILLCGLGALGVSTARAQVDFYGEPRIFSMDPAHVIYQSTTNQVVTNSAPLDMHGCQGIGLLYLSFTNGGGTNGWGGFSGTSNALAAVLNVTLQYSADTTNWSTATNLSIATNQAFYYTNFMYGGSNLVATNNILVPGTISNAVPAVNGFAGTFLVPSPFTNNGIFVTNSFGGAYAVGVPVFDALRYWRLNYFATNSIGAYTNTSWTVSAVVIARRANPGAFGGQY